MATKKFPCPKCKNVEVRREKFVFNADGTKNTQHPLIYYGIIFLLAVTVVMRVPEEWQVLAAIVFTVAGLAIVTGLIIYRRRLRTGYEYVCWKCDHFWHEIDPAKNPDPNP